MSACDPDIQLALAEVCFRRGSGHDFLTALAANALAISSSGDCDLATTLLPEDCRSYRAKQDDLLNKADHQCEFDGNLCVPKT